MIRYPVFFVVFILALSGMPEKISAGPIIPIPIVSGKSEELIELGNLPSGVSQAVAKELGAKVTVAFLYERSHVCWVDLWTWNGRYVLHAGDKYWEPDSVAWRKMLGQDPSTKYGTPILYRIPLLPALLFVALIGYGIRRRFLKTDDEVLETLMNDSQYHRSMETIFGSHNDEERGIAITTLDEQKFLQAKNQLLAEGIDAHTADSNLRKLTDAVLANTNLKIDTCFGVASQLDQEGEWVKSVELYSQIIALLPNTDERMVYARNCHAAVNEKLAAKRES